MCNISCDTECTILILKSMGINYPVLKAYGLELAKPLLVIVDEGQLKTAVNIFSDGGAPQISEYTREKERKKIFSETNSKFVIYPYSSTKKGKDFLTFLSIVAKLGVMGETQINAMPLVISEGIPLDIDLNDFFTVFINGNLSGVYIDGMTVVPPDRELAVVENQIKLRLSDVFSQEKKVLLAAVCFLYPNMFSDNFQSGFENLLDCADRLTARNEENRDTNNLGEFFIQELYRWQERTGFCLIYALPNLEMSITENLHQVMVYNDDFLFVKEELFQEIATPFLGIFSIGVLKRELVKEGILCPENAQTYTAKMSYYNVAGEYRRERMLRFKRSRLNCVGELDFVDLCEEI
ncbi:MAG TPA: hypothetical protein DDY31_16315 [Lachnospiraceae bacterium]|nr:hypothetical protein [Lachnospiraceae bacterium]